MAVMPAGGYSPHEKREAHFTISEGCKFSFSKAGKVDDSLVRLTGYVISRLWPQLRFYPLGGRPLCFYSHRASHCASIPWGADCFESVRGWAFVW